MSVAFGVAIRDERRRRRWTLAALAVRAGVSPALVAQIEAGVPASLESCARVAVALDLQPDLVAADPRQRSRSTRQDEDFVHAAMGELEADRLRGLGRDVRIDEPYQHYQFAGRADVVAWDRTARALLHIENRTQFPNVQEALGSYGAKRTYLGSVMAGRVGLRGGWASETHVVAALWTSEVLHVLRLRETTFRVTCPDPLDSFLAWWTGRQADLHGSTSLIALVDPAPGVRAAFRIGDFGATTRPRHRGYAEMADALRAR